MYRNMRGTEKLNIGIIFLGKIEELARPRKFIKINRILKNVTALATSFTEIIVRVETYLITGNFIL